MKRPLELGTLEQSVMQSMWRLRRATVGEVVANLSLKRAYTTIMTTLDRLYRKGLVQRSRNGRSFVYESHLGPAELQRAKARQFFEAALEGHSQSKPVLSCFIDAVSDRDAAALDELELLIRQKRKQLRKG